MRNFVLLSATTAIFLSGCAIGNDYVKPQFQVPAQFRHTDLNESESAQKWWQAFGDPVINELVEEALSKNLDLRVSTAQIDSLAGALAVTTSNLLPQLNAQGSQSAQKNSQLLDGRAPNAKIYTKIDTAAFSLGAFELDFWGKWQRANEAAKASLLSSEYGRHSLRISVAGSTVFTYLQLRTLDKQLQIAVENLAVQEEITKLSEVKAQLGAITQAELLQSQAALLGAKAALYPLQSQIISTQNTLAVLLAKSPVEIKRGKSIDALNSETVVPAGLPSKLLLRRPDILQAEQSLVSANAQIGIAKAAYLPTFSLTGLFGQQSADLSTLLKSGANMWQLIPGVTLPIFSAGRLAGQEKQAQAEYEKNLALYEKSILTALKEVDDALSSRQNLSTQYALLNKQVEALKEARRLSAIQYEYGQISYLPLLVSTQFLLSAQNQAVVAQNSYLGSYVQICKALAGGW